MDAEDSLGFNQNGGHDRLEKSQAWTGNNAFLIAKCARKMWLGVLTLGTSDSGDGEENPKGTESGLETSDRIGES